MLKAAQVLFLFLDHFLGLASYPSSHTGAKEIHIFTNQFFLDSKGVVTVVEFRLYLELQKEIRKGQCKVCTTK
jgi:hypothetical protein